MHGPVERDLPIPASALVIGAHPDDADFACGATLARWASSGSAVHYVVLTDGSKGSWDPSADPTEVASRREAEQSEAARAIGASSVTFLGYTDGELQPGLTERRRLTAVIRSLRPEVVLGHDPWRRYRLHPDHRNAGWLTVDAVVAARDPHFYPEMTDGSHRPGALLLFEADEPDHVETADGWLDVKIEALLAHRSQYLSTHGIDPSSPDLAAEVREFRGRVEAQMASHGALADVALGEAFRLITDI